MARAKPHSLLTTHAFDREGFLFKISEQVNIVYNETIGSGVNDKQYAVGVGNKADGSRKRQDCAVLL